MIRIELATLMARLNDTTRCALEEAASLAISHSGAEVTVAQWLFTLIDTPFADICLILKQAGLQNDALKHALSEGFDPHSGHDGQYPVFSPLLIELLQEAWLLGSLELGEERIRGGLLLLAALLNPARYLPMAAIRCLEPINRETLRKNFSTLLADSAEVNGPRQASAEGPVPQAGEAATALGRYGVNFSWKAAQGGIDPVLGRDQEIDLMIDILSRRRKNNPIAVGDAGVGKSALVEGLALRIAQGRVPAALLAVQLWGLDMGALQAGASVKGEFEKRLKAVIDEVKSSPVPIILFIDEAHTLIGAGNPAGGSDAANLLKPALARGELRTIAATTWSEYKQYFERDPALSRRFQLVKLMEPSVEQAVHMLRGLRTVYESAHRVYISDAALHAAAALSARYVAGRQLPDKAIDVLDTACARVATGLKGEPRRLAAIDNAIFQVEAEVQILNRDLNAGKAVDPARIEVLGGRGRELLAERQCIVQAWEQQKGLVEQILEKREALQGDHGQAISENQRDELRNLVEALRQVQREGALLHADVGVEQIAQVIASWTGIPVNTLTGDQMLRLRELPKVLKADVKGQDVAVEHIHRHLLTAMADLRRPGTPLGAFLLVGPSGVGKTETALRVADHLFGGKQFLTVINMSEYQEKHTVSRLLGAPPGYVGYGEGGVLTEAIRQKPYSVVLLDEVEKAHAEVLNIFYQAFDKGEVADGEGRLIDCKNILFFLTSNLGFEQADSSLERLDEETLRKQLLRFFKPALLARMHVVQYNALDKHVLDQIVDHRLDRLQQQFKSRYGSNLRVTQAVRDTLRSRCVRHANGARMLDASIDGELLPPLSLAVLSQLADGKAIEEAMLDVEHRQFVAVLT